MFSVQYLAREYSGNASTTTGYPIDFPYLEASDINVSVMTQGAGTVAVAAGVATFSSAQTTLEVGHKVRISGVLYEVDTRTSDTVFSFTTRATIASTTFHLPASATVLTEGQFTVVTSGAGAPYVTTAAAYLATSIVRVYAMRPLNQQFDLPEGGALPVAEIERALDHVVMLILQTRLEAGLSGSVVSGPASGVKDLVVVSDATVRGATAPRFQGQILVQVSDWSLWIGETAAVGDWREFSSGVTPSALSPKRLTVAVWSDAGTPGAAQNAMISTVNSWAPDIKLGCGDNTYAPATYAAAHAAFGSLLTQLEVLGNHDVDYWLNHEASFSHIPVNYENHRRYWNFRYGNLLSIYGLHSGLDSAGNLIEPDGNTVGSTQHDWFVSELATDECRWKIAAFHHPPFTPSKEANRVCVAMDWPELDQMSAIFTGHDHIPWKGTFRGVPLFATSGGIISDGSVHPYGALAGLGSVSGVDAILDGRQIVAKLDISTERFVVSYHDIWTGQMLQQFGLDAEWRANEWGQEVLDPDSPLTTGWHFVGICPARFSLGAWYIGTKQAAGEVTGEIYVGTSPSDGHKAAEFTIADGILGTTTPSLLSGTPRGGYVQVRILTATEYPDRLGLQVNMLGRQLSTV